MLYSNNVQIHIVLKFSSDIPSILPFAGNTEVRNLKIQRTLVLIVTFLIKDIWLNVLVWNEMFLLSINLNYWEYNFRF